MAEELQQTAQTTGGVPVTGPGDQNRGNETPPAAPVAAPANTGTTPGHQSGPGEGEGELPKTKEALDRRIEKAKRAGVREVLVALGFEGLETPETLQQAQDDLKGLVAFARQQKAATQTAEERLAGQMSALEKRVKAAEERVVAAERERDEARADLLTRSRREAILRAAARARHPDDVVTWAESNRPDLVAKVLKDDGATDEDVAKQIVAGCAQARREWFATPVLGVPSNHEGRAPSNMSELERKLELARQTARQALR